MQEEYKLRREKLAKKMKNNSVAIIPGNQVKPRNADNDYKFYQDHDFLYLTNFHEDNALALIVKDDKGIQFYLFCNKADPQKEIWGGKIIGQDKAVSEYQADEAFVSSEEEYSKRIPGILANRKKIYFPFEHDSLKQAKINAWTEDKYTKEKFADITRLLANLRYIKSEYEIATMRTASTISANAHSHVMKKVKPHLTEKVIEAIFFKKCAQQGGGEYAYPVIAASGINACTLHYEKNNCILKEGDLLLFDAGIEYNYYASDITRTIPISGKFTKPQKEIYEIVLAAQKAGIAALKPNVTRRDIEDIVIFELAKGLNGIGVIKLDVKQLIAENKGSTIKNCSHFYGEIKKYYPHGFGHYIGLDVHDTNFLYPMSKRVKFEPGVCITVEPGLYFAADDSDIPEQYRGIGIRIEDTCLITENGCEVLSKAAPKEIQDIENKILKRPPSNDLLIHEASKRFESGVASNCDLRYRFT